MQPVKKPTEVVASDHRYNGEDDGDPEVLRGSDVMAEDWEDKGVRRHGNPKAHRRAEAHLDQGLAARLHQHCVQVAAPTYCHLTTTAPPNSNRSPDFFARTAARNLSQSTAFGMIVTSPL